MPELPEVETTRRGLIGPLRGNRIETIIVRIPRLRWPVPEEITRELPGQTIQGISRRGKYLLFHTMAGTMILHLGMSGSLRIIPASIPPEKHDHADFILEKIHEGPLCREQSCLRFRDPRRFGAILWTDAAVSPLTHPLLAKLGPEPVEDGVCENGPSGNESVERRFSGDWLFRVSRNRRTPVKCLLLDGAVLAGIGNIYANEALFRAGVLPDRSAGELSLREYGTLARAIRETLTDAIASGGTTLRDFFQSDGKPGYFQQKLLVYGRAGRPCPRCGRPIEQVRIGQRSSFFCRGCQA
uniref:Formamidopyrimidine-DNA glycosylase n=1 Tax=Candidatus Kentrum sp. DK TaxID=2126562 RepID=A0A450T4C9_9GAMM|nr:MAG: DNA-(apurinic or apyrimidinic site) lyase [Candidatus Kentron sp. DK]